MPCHNCVHYLFYVNSIVHPLRFRFNSVFNLIMFLLFIFLYIENKVSFKGVPCSSLFSWVVSFSTMGKIIFLNIALLAALLSPDDFSRLFHIFTLLILRSCMHITFIICCKSFVTYTFTFCFWKKILFPQIFRLRLGWAKLKWWRLRWAQLDWTQPKLSWTRLKLRSTQPKLRWAQPKLHLTKLKLLKLSQNLILAQNKLSLTMMKLGETLLGQNYLNSVMTKMTKS